MPEQIEFELSEQELATLLKASEPVPYLVIGGVEPRSPQEHANRAWQDLGRTRGFIWDTVIAGRDDRHFFATPTRASR